MYQLAVTNSGHCKDQSATTQSFLKPSLNDDIQASNLVEILVQGCTVGRCSSHNPTPPVSVLSVSVGEGNPLTTQETLQHWDRVKMDRLGGGGGTVDRGRKGNKTQGQQ